MSMSFTATFSAVANSLLYETLLSWVIYSTYVRYSHCIDQTNPGYSGHFPALPRNAISSMRSIPADFTDINMRQLYVE